MSRSGRVPPASVRPYPPPVPPCAAERQLLTDLFYPERLLRPGLTPHLAHLHINLLPGYQRAGHGRALVETFLQAAAAADAPSCHLAVYTANTAARRFYAKLGWHHVPAHNPGPWSPTADLVGKLPLRRAATAIRWHRGGSSQIARERRWSWSSGCSGRWWSVTARDR